MFTLTIKVPASMRFIQTYIQGNLVVIEISAYLKIT